ncbi:LOW QUALITY PROTEIN: hypothetical protein Cgig2_028175 [Carnegiea gigantea]|uniref:Uncharacterized protein n=1 Tax=Carnegiea gigantea TaxID=171969 RepID=A0A9Q1GV61_9CARY|nr:LOW QUALITY PROTEIN: hypothetical protein Cgig2_028175 [Carnegiea gigantea]
MQSFRDSQRVFKCLRKKDCYYKYDNDADIGKHCPKAIPLIAKKWVMQSFRDSQRVFKCRRKKDCYYKYDNDADIGKHCPKRVQEPDFKEISAKKFKNHEQQENMHTMGNVSFARAFHRLAVNHQLKKKRCSKKLKQGKRDRHINNQMLVDAIKSSLAYDAQNDIATHKEKLKNEYNVDREKVEGDLQVEKENLNQVLEAECAIVVDMQKEPET